MGRTSVSATGSTHTLSIRRGTGRGSAWAALLGIIVLQSIQSGLNLMNVDSSVRFIVTGLVLLLAVAIDSVSRKARSSSGRG